MSDDPGGPGARQVPPPGEHNLDHVAYFVPDRADCERALLALGFAPTPFSLQMHRVTPDGPLEPAGTGNHCVMLAAGYLEFLVPLAETPVAAQLRQSIDRYVGLHSIVFGTADAERDRERLLREGFAPLAPIALQRTIGTAGGEATVRFTVLRVPPGTMAEGRIQFCRHHTPELVWQPRWVAHPNTCVALAGVYACVDDPGEAAARYGRFTGKAAVTDRLGARLATARGWVRLLDRAGAERLLGQVPPAVPWIGGCELLCADLARARSVLERGGLEPRAIDADTIAVAAPAAIGGVLVFRQAPAGQ